MAVGQFAPEFSQENLAPLIAQYSKSLEQPTADALRSVKAAQFGQGLGYGSPYQAGVGQVQAGKLADISKFQLGLAQQGLGAETQGRESVLQRAYGTSERLGSQDFSAGQSALQRAYGTSERLGSQQYGTSERVAGQTYSSGENALNRGLQEAGLTGMYNGQQTMAGQENAANIAEKALQNKTATQLGYANDYEMSLADKAQVQERLKAKGVPMGGAINGDIIGAAGTPYNQPFTFAGMTFKWLPSSNSMVRIS